MQREWKTLSKGERLVILEEFEKVISAEIDNMKREINAMFDKQKLPIRLEVEMRMVFDRNDDPRG